MILKCQICYVGWLTLWRFGLYLLYPLCYPQLQVQRQVYKWLINICWINEIMRWSLGQLVEDLTYVSEVIKLACKLWAYNWNTDFQVPTVWEHILLNLLTLKCVCICAHMYVWKDVHANWRGRGIEELVWGSWDHGKYHKRQL